MFFDFTNFAIKFSKTWGLHFPSSLFFGEYDFPQEEE